MESVEIFISVRSIIIDFGRLEYLSPRNEFYYLEKNFLETFVDLKAADFS